MRRVVSAALAGLDALALVAIGLGIPLLAAVGIWGMNFGFSTDLAGFYRSSVVVWLLGHGVDVSVQVDPVLAAQLGVAQSEPFRVTAAIGGFAVLSFILAVRAGRRAALSFAPVVALLSLLVVTALCALALTLSAASPTALPSRWQGVVMPLGIVAGLVLVVAGFLFTTSAQTARGTQLRSERADLAGLIQDETERVRARQDLVAELDAD